MCPGSFTLLCCFMKITSFYGETNCTECVIWKCNLWCHMDQGTSFPMQYPISTHQQISSHFSIIISNIEDHSLSVFLSGWYSRVVGEGVQRKTFLGSQEKYQTSNTSKLESMVGRTHGKRKTSSTYILIIVWEFRFVLWFFISFIINFRLEFLGSSLDLQCEEVQKVKEVYRRKLKIRFISL